MWPAGLRPVRGVAAAPDDAATVSVVKLPVFASDDPAAGEHFQRNGWALVSATAAGELEQLRGWVDEIASWPDADGPWLHYREQTDFGPRLCRSENFVPFHEGMRRLLCERLAAVAAVLLSGPAVLYKEKINYKLVGGAGYSPHQDAPAYPFLHEHVSAMVAVDDATIDNGCLEVVNGAHHDLLQTDERGCIAADVVATLEWMLIPMRAGEALFFHSRTPHRSGANNSSYDRRALFPTYNAAAEGDLRAAYYAAKLAEIADRPITDGRVTVSLIGDFEGRPVSPGTG